MNSDRSPKPGNVFALRVDGDSLSPPILSAMHSYGDEKICITDHRGYATPRGRSPEELVLDASEGFIPLWGEGVNLRWRFNEHALSFFQHPNGVKRTVRKLLSEALLAWGGMERRLNSVSVRTLGISRLWCVMQTIVANMVVFWPGIFPDSGRHHLELFTRLCSLSGQEGADQYVDS